MTVPQISANGKRYQRINGVWVRVPTLEEFEAYTGAHTPRLWCEVGIDWQCPACKRSKFELLRWTRRSLDHRRTFFWGWTAALHTHHDHAGDYDWGKWQGRFPDTVICELCNAADGNVKRQIGISEPPYFSFSPHEIGQFVIPTPHGKHRFNLSIAQQIAIDLGVLV